MAYTEDDIQFLGGESVRKTPEHPVGHHHPKWIWVVTAVFIALLLFGSALFLWLTNRRVIDFDYPVSRYNSEIIGELSRPITDTANVGVMVKTDSINNVPFILYQLQGVKARLSSTIPSDTDTTVCLVIHAWDYYFENKQYRYIGDVVIDGKQISSGVGKAGFVAMANDKWQLGVGQDDSLKTYVMQRHGSLFRQYALVSAGQICLKQFALKGKVTRCALARKGTGEAYYVESVHNESLYDFAEALADYGFVDAVYITGGNDGNTFYRDVQGQSHGQYPVDKKHSRNFLVFTR